MIKRLLFSSFLFLFIPHLILGQSDSRIITDLIKSLDATSGLKVTFQIKSEKEAQEGSYYALGKRFFLDTKQLKAWYNGTELWVYLAQNNEVTLSIPENEDLEMINPLLNIKALRKENIKIQTRKISSGLTEITATPKKESPKEFKRFEVIYSTIEKIPLSLSLYEIGGGKSWDILILQLLKGASPEMKEELFFSFQENKLPGTMVIDLR